MHSPVLQRFVCILIHCVQRMVGVHLVYLQFRKPDQFQIVAGIRSCCIVVIFRDQSADAFLLTSARDLCTLRQPDPFIGIAVVQAEEL